MAPMRAVNYEGRVCFRRPAATIMTRDPDITTPAPATGGTSASGPDIEIRPGSDPEPGCPCCDPVAAQPQGFVTRGAEALALYFTDGALEGPVSAAELTISLGRWQEGSSPAERRTASFRLIRSAERALRIEPLDAAHSRWHVLAMLGRMMSAAETQADPDRELFLGIAEKIAERDPRIAEALAGERPAAARLSIGKPRAATGFAASKG